MSRKLPIMQTIAPKSESQKPECWCLNLLVTCPWDFVKQHPLLQDLSSPCATACTTSQYPHCLPCILRPINTSSRMIYLNSARAWLRPVALPEYNRYSLDCNIRKPLLEKHTWVYELQSPSWKWYSSPLAEVTNGRFWWNAGCAPICSCLFPVLYVGFLLNCSVIFLGKHCHCRLETCCRNAPGKTGTNWLEMHVSPNINYSGSMNILYINLGKGHLSTSGIINIHLW